MFNKITILCSILILVVHLSYAQKDERLAQGISPIQEVAIKQLPKVDNQALIQKELQRRSLEPGAAQFAKPFEVDITPFNSGIWETDAQGLAVWRYRIHSKGAESLNLGFTEFNLPPGATLMLYSEDYSIIQGPFTPADNEDHNQFWTPIIPTDQLVVEVRLPKPMKDDLQLKLHSINHDFIGFGNPEKASGSCNLDVNCGAADGFPQVEDNRDIIRSVAVYSFGGFNICTGFLINNTAQDETPYFMTADHCGLGAGNAPSLVVYWNYENSTCRQPNTPASGANGDGPLSDFNTGSTLRASYGPSDFTLVELDDPVSETANAFMAGWSREDVAPSSSIAIHHPATEEKRISFEDDPSTITAYLDDTPDPTSTHIRVDDWDLGTTEGGSSGSPLFDQNKRVVGQLHGGFAACGNDDPDWYGRFFRSWEGGDSANTRLRDWLDPNNTGVTVLDGKDLSFSLTANTTILERCAPEAAIFEIEVSDNFVNPVNLTATSNLMDLPGNELILSTGTASAGSTFTIEVNTSGQMTGQYLITVTGNDGIEETSVSLSVIILGGVPGQLTAIAPANGAVDVPISPELSWMEDFAGTTYEYQIASDIMFIDIIASGDNLTETFANGFILETGETYYWRIRGMNLCGSGDWSTPFSFETSNDACAGLFAADVPITISESGMPTIISEIEVPLTGKLVSITLEGLEIAHTWVGDLEGYLTSPKGTQIELFNRAGVPGTNFGCGENNLLVTFSDNAPNTYDDFDNTCEGNGNYAIEGTFQPLTSLSAFEEEEVEGTWTLTIIDNQNFDGGTLLDWSLDICADANAPALSASTDSLITCLGDAASLNLNLSGFSSNSALSTSWTGPNSSTVLGFSSNQVDLSNIPPNSSFDLNISLIDNPEPGTYEINLLVTDAEMNEAVITIVMIVLDGATAPTLSQPMNGMVDVNTNPIFQWFVSPPQPEYVFEISTDQNFGTILETQMSTFPQVSLDNPLAPLTTYYWRVRSVSGNCGTATSEVFSFTTDMTINVQSVFDTDLEVFPNPTKGLVHLQFEQALTEELNIQVIDINGRVLQNTIEGDASLIELDLSTYPTGTYLLRLTHKGESITQKILRIN